MALTSWTAILKFRMCPQLLFVLFILIDVRNTKSQESVQYLQNAMWDLKNRIHTGHSKRRIDSLQVKTSEMEKDDRDNVPMLSLTKAELAALYEAALNREHSMTASPDDHNTPYIQAVVHELDEDASEIHEDKSNDDHYGQPDTADTSGYYYYYYPVNSFMDGSSSAPNHVQPEPHHNVEEEKVHPQYHSHTHQHNVHITSMKEADKKKVMEPLFMAVSSFIGMAVMFILSIIFLPKFGALKSRGVKQTSSGEMTNLVHIVLKAIEGDDCSERVVCELGKAAKAFKVYDNRFVKLFRRISPTYVKWYVDGVTKYAQTNLTCSKIQCRRKNAMKPKHVYRKF